MLQPVFIAGAWQQAHEPVGVFHAVNPALGEKLPEQYPVSSRVDIDKALAAAHQVVMEQACPPDVIAAFLESFARAIEEREEKLINLAHLETGLPKETRLRQVELPRTTRQLRQAAEVARERSWCQATIDRVNNLRAKYAPLPGPVVIFGPNNFPFAFNSLAGGDFAAAIAAGNPVIAKANPGHPGTTRLFAEAASEALQASNLPGAMVQLLYHFEPESGLYLVSHPLTGASAFTGSRRAGLRLKAAAEAASKPIYLEMSSLNPVFLLPYALDERLPEIADAFCASCLLGTGQFCTKPGLVILVRSGQSGQFIQRVRSSFQTETPGFLLNQGTLEQLGTTVELLQQHGVQVLTGGLRSEGSGYRFANTLLHITGDQFLEQAEALQSEAFGNASLVIEVQDTAQLIAVARRLEGNLTGTIYSHSQGADDALYGLLEPVVRQKVGRLLNDKMPTGVTVSPAMMHGGPFPASGHPGFTAVGLPHSLLRFAVWQSYDNVPERRLPPELQKRNPTGHTWRFIDNTWTQEDL